MYIKLLLLRGILCCVFFSFLCIKPSFCPPTSGLSGCHGWVWLFFPSGLSLSSCCSFNAAQQPFFFSFLDLSSALSPSLQITVCLSLHIRPNHNHLAQNEEFCCYELWVCANVLHLSRVKRRLIHEKVFLSHSPIRHTDRHIREYINCLKSKTSRQIKSLHVFYIYSC